MTTVAVNKKMMAGDKKFVHMSGTSLVGATKIWEIPDTTAKSLFGCKRVFIGGAGNADAFGKMVNYLWLPEGKPPKLRDVEMIMLNDKGQIYHATTFSNWLEVRQPFFAIGSGMQFAIAAMESGKTPYEAVRIASKFDNNTGKGFNKLEMK